MMMTFFFLFIHPYPTENDEKNKLDDEDEMIQDDVDE